MTSRNVSITRKDLKIQTRKIFLIQKLKKNLLKIKITVFPNFPTTKIAVTHDIPSVATCIRCFYKIPLIDDGSIFTAHNFSTCWLLKFIVSYPHSPLKHFVHFVLNVGKRNVFERDKASNLKPLIKSVELFLNRGARYLFIYKLCKFIFSAIFAFH